MFKTPEQIKTTLRDYGEVMVVLESDREYALHPHDTEFLDDVVQTEGIGEESGEYQIVVFPPEAVEHFYAHREN